MGDTLRTAPSHDVPPPGHPDRATTIAHSGTTILSPLVPADQDGLVDIALAALAPARKAAPTVLDIGCGKGDLLVRFARRGVRGLGLDRNPWFIEDAKRLAAAAGVADRATLRTAEAAEEQLATGMDIAVCIGATGALGGPVLAPAALAKLLGPGGIGLIGEGFWRQPPPVDGAETFGIGPDEMTGLDATVERVAAGGLEPIAVVQASQAGWDAYEGGYAEALDRWLDDHPNDPERHRLRTRALMMRTSWADWRREAMGFCVVVARRPEAEWDLRRSVWDHRAPRCAARCCEDRSVDEHSAAELLPTLYRRVLDAATRLEWAGDRPAALRIRRHAIAVYSLGWDIKGAKALEGLEVQALALLAGRPPARSRMFLRLPN